MNYNISDFSGWMSQDDSFLWKGQCIFQQGIDTIRFPWEIRLMPPLTYSTRYGTEEITSIFSPASWTIWVGTGAWIVRNYELNETKIDTGDTRDIIDWILFRGYFYIFSNRYVYKTTYTSGSLSALSTFYDHWTAYWYCHPVIYAGNEMYYPSLNTVRYIDEFWNDNVMPQTFSTNVRAISISGNTLRVYTETTLAIIDIGTKTVSYSQLLPFVVSGLATDGIADYVTTEWDELYVCSGLEWRKLASYEQSETLNQLSTEARDKFTFRSSNNGKTMCCANWRVFTIDRVVGTRAMMYGTKMQGLPNAFQYLPKHDNESTGGVNVYSISPRSIFAQNNKVYIGYQCNGEERVGTIDFNSTDTACYEGIYMMSSTDLWDYSSIKALEEIRVGKDGTQAEIWMSIDGGNFTLLDDLDQTEIEHKVMNVWKDFREVAFMVKLYNQFDRIKNLNIRYNQRQV